MGYDISEIGAINCTLNFDEDWYSEYLQDNGLEDSDEVRVEFVKENCDYDIEFLDSETFHSMGGFSTMTYEEICDEFGDLLGDSVLSDCMDGKEHSFEIQLYQNDKFNIKNPQELNAVAVKYLRHGEYFKGCRGFILTNGVVVYTESEHNQCSKIPGIKGTFDFIRLGNIRVLDGGIDLALPPTPSQRIVLEKVFECYYGDKFYLDLLNDKFGSDGKSYNRCIPEEIMNDIDVYFSSGVLRKNTFEITQNKLTELIRESIKKIFTEGVSDITYHFTSLMSCVDILKTNTFNLTMSSNKSDAYNSKRLFYLSTQRSRNKELGYAGHLGTCVRMQLDGRILATRYKGMPIDYWDSMGKQSYYNPENDSIYGRGFSNGRRTHHNFEMEDRVFSYEPTISNASKYINRIDIYLDTRQDRIEKTKVQKYIDDVNRTVAKEKEYIVILYALANRYDIPVFIYDNLKQFNNMTNVTINNEIAQLYKDDFHATTEKEYNEFDRYKISKDFNRRSKYVDILCELFNVLSIGEIYSMRDKAYKLVATTLKQFGLEAYIADTMKEIKRKWGNSFEESCSLLSNTINAPIRKLNTEYPDDDSNKIMKFGAYILRKYGCSNFDTLKTKWRELKYANR